ncbi:MAG: hypothetical protein Q9187_008854, partial [Circinaria calcarea]
FIPDFFFGKSADLSWYPPDNQEKWEKLGAFFQAAAAPPKNAEKVPGIVKEITEKTGGIIQKWGALGMCWGGKILSLTSGPGTPFSAVAEVHPAMVDPSDAGRITVPLCMLASKDENPDDVKKFKEGLKVENHVETFGDQIHGWMAARYAYPIPLPDWKIGRLRLLNSADLNNPRVKEEYERGYSIVLDFL